MSEKKSEVLAAHDAAVAKAAKKRAREDSQIQRTTK